MLKLLSYLFASLNDPNVWAPVVLEIFALPHGDSSIRAWASGLQRLLLEFGAMESLFKKQPQQAADLADHKEARVALFNSHRVLSIEYRKLQDELETEYLACLIDGPLDDTPAWLRIHRGKPFPHFSRTPLGRKVSDRRQAEHEDAGVEDNVMALPRSWRPEGTLLCSLSFPEELPNVIDLCAAALAISNTSHDCNLDRASNYLFATALYFVMQEDFKAKQSFGEVDRRGRWGGHGKPHLWASPTASRATVACSNHLKLVPEDGPLPKATSTQNNAIQLVSDGPLEPLPAAPQQLSKAGQDRLARFRAAFRATRRTMHQRMEQEVARPECEQKFEDYRSDASTSTSIASLPPSTLIRQSSFPTSRQDAYPFAPIRVAPFTQQQIPYASSVASPNFHL